MDIGLCPRPAHRGRFAPSRRWRPESIELLEGRALRAASVIDPTFNGGRTLLTPATLLDSSSANVNSAVAVQADGKIVVAGQGDSATDPSGETFLVSVRRYNPDGTLDATFGSGGEALVPILRGASSVDSVTPSLLVQGDDKIVLAVNRATTAGLPPTGATPTPLGTTVIRLTGAGVLDSSFGTGGIAMLTSNTPTYESLILQPGGKILLEGVAPNQSASVANTPTTVLTRLDSTGALDPTFHGGSPLFLPAFNAGPGLQIEPLLAGGVGLTSTGQIRVATAFGTLTGTPVSDFGVVQLNDDGSYDTSYGASGLTLVANTTAGNLASALVLPSGSVVLGVNLLGTVSFAGQVIRLGADGSLDASFSPRTLPFDIDSLAAGLDGSIAVGGGRTTAYGAFEPILAIDVARLTAAGQLDTKFAPGGFVRVGVPYQGIGPFSFGSVVSATGLAVAPDGRIVVAGTSAFFGSAGPSGTVGSRGSQAALGVIRPVNHLAGADGDYDGDNTSDLAAELTSLGLFAVRRSTGGDVLQPFGALGSGQTIPAPGDYDGDGIADVAAYLPEYGVLAYRASSGTGDHLVPFGPAGSGIAIPVPGDYDGDGKTDVALFVPSEALYLIDPSGGGAPYAVQFGAAGVGQSIPVPGDYDGSGRTELAVYVPAVGELIYRSPYATFDTAVPFGPPGLGNALPLAADFDGDGITDFAVYLPSTGTFAIHPARGANYAVQFGAAGVGMSIPIRGDFDGDGRDDLAVFIPSLGVFADRPSGGGPDVLQAFGTGGATTVPAAALPEPTGRVTISSLSTRPTDPSSGLVFYLPDGSEIPRARKKVRT